MNSRYALVCVLAIGLLVAGCSSDTGSPAPNTTPVPTRATAPAAEPATAGAPAVPPVGKVIPIGNAPEGIVIGTSGIGAVAARNPDGVELIDAATGAVRQTVPTVGAARHLSLAGPDGPVLVPLERPNVLSELTLDDGRMTCTAAGVGRQPHDAAQTAGGTVVVTNELGGGVVFVRGGAVVASLPAGPVQPGGVAAVGDYAAVADVQGNGVWVYDGSTHRQMAQGPVGVKLTHAVAMSGDLAAFADTDGAAVFVEHIDPQLAQVAKIDAPGKPYGLAYDAARRRLYVTLTASNLIRLIDVSDATKPRILGDVPTVQQPNSVAVEPRSGSVLVTGSGPDGGSGLQIVTPDLLPPE
ncbi:YncE family protein [Mycobacterium sp.]|uniref:YncE family protein n=1 Tax=Mycobacterium sp. TaxID=1785 RepID=UPI003CBA2CC1